MLEDNYPILLISGKRIAEIVGQYTYKQNITLQEYLDSLDKEQELKNPEDILKEE